MAIPVLILGESGTGKSCSMRNFNAGEVAIMNVSKKALPFRTELKTYDSDDYGKIIGMIKIAVGKGIKSIVIDDSQYLMVNAFMRRSNETGYQKYTDMARTHWDLIEFIKTLSPDVIVYMMSHIDRDQNGNEKAKTVGKMIDQYITLEGEFTIVLKTKAQDGRYFFQTHNGGFDTVKSPFGMFEDDFIDNDLKLVDQTIRTYYNLNGGNENA